MVEKLGLPDMMDLDHDLGETDTAKVFLKWLANYDPEHPPQYRVHSANPNGKAWIESYMESWKRSLEM